MRGARRARGGGGEKNQAGEIILGMVLVLQEALLVGSAAALRTIRFELVWRIWQG